MQAKEFKSFFKTVGGNEGSKCKYPTRLDLYGCGCQHDCKYCYAKSLLNFRKLWDAQSPAVADVRKVEKVIKKLPKGTILRLGGMTDCFQPCEIEHRNTYKAIQLLNKYGIGYLIVTKSHLVANDEYMAIYDKDLCHIQVTVTSTDAEVSRSIEKASYPEQRIAAIEKLHAAGFDVAIRLSPFIPQFVDLDVINSIKCDKILIEFLRINTWIKKWLDIDFAEFKVKSGGYLHLPLNKKIELLSLIKKEHMSVCEDVTCHYEYWRENVNENKDDCCNLRKGVK